MTRLSLVSFTKMLPQLQDDIMYAAFSLRPFEGMVKSWLVGFYFGQEPFRSFYRSVHFVPKPFI